MRWPRTMRWRAAPSSLAAARAALGADPAFDRAWQNGRALTLEQAMDFALDETVGHA
jgi:hypothetical protein